MYCGGIILPRLQGAAPIIGPAIAVIWGWVPAIIWVVFGPFLWQASMICQPFGPVCAIRVSLLARLLRTVMGTRVRSLMMVVIFLLLLMVNAVFGVAIANMMIKTPSSVLPVWGALVVAFIIGQCIYRYKMNLVWVSIIGVVALYGLIYLGPMFPVVLPETFMGLPDNAVWIIILFAYAAIPHYYQYGCCCNRAIILMGYNYLLVWFYCMQPYLLRHQTLSRQRLIMIYPSARRH